MKKAITLILAILAACFPAAACTVCEKQQPELLQGITHGAGPESNWDYLIITAVAIVVLLTLIYSIKFLLWPGEESKTHIKRTILFFE